MLYVQWTSAKAEAAGGVWRGVRCDHCGTAYVFRVEVRVRHKEVELYSQGSPGQRARAEQAARDRLAYLLERKIEPVPCPSCGRYQPDMCDELRRRRYGWLYTAGMFLLTIGALGLVAAAGTATDPRPHFHWMTCLAVEVAGAGLGATALILKRRLSASYDPNDRVPADRRMDLALDRAMTKKEFARRHPSAEALEQD